MIFVRQTRNLVLFLCVCACFLSAELFAEISFSSPNLNEKNEVLFALTHDVPGSAEYSTVFKGKIRNGGAEYFPRALTCFPERIEIFEGADKMQIRNRYGRAIYDFSSETLTWAEHVSAFPENAAWALPVAMSANGKWFCSVERKDMLHGRLFITETESRRRILLDDNSAFSYSKVPVKWADDGKNFIYEKNGTLYFCNPEMLFKRVLIQEEFRKIGSGKISSVEWNDSELITYISSDLIFQINIKELISLGMYTEFIQLGKAVGRLPQKFDGNSDKFWVNKKGNAFVIIKGDQVISYCKIAADAQGGDFVQTMYSRSFIEEGMTPLAFSVFWTPLGNPAVCAKLVLAGSGVECSAVYTISATGKMTRRIFVKNTHSEISVSPDQMYLAVLAGENIFIYRIDSWSKAHQLKGERAVSLAWRGNGNLIIGGTCTVKRLSMADFTESALFAASAKKAWWDKNGDIVFKDCASHTFVLNENSNRWTYTPSPEKKTSVQNDEYRVFCGTTKNALYKNALYIRTLAGKITTRAYVAQSATAAPPRNKAALIFDADENADGLESILAVCSDYNIKATFFFNGEFIRRYPNETRKIAESGHECAAIFFNGIDLTNKFVYDDKKYVAKGLARLEDEFYQCTGKELSLYWHAPFNKADEKIRAEGAAAGYTYIDLDQPYIIPISAGSGITSGPVLYERFDLIVNELFSTGADIVTVSGLGSY